MIGAEKSGSFGWCEVEHWRSGVLLRKEVIENQTTNAGLAADAARFAGITMDPFDYIALGTGTTAAAATDTALESEITDTGLARAQDATPTRITTTVTNDTASIEYTWTATGSKAVTEAGLFNAAAAGTMYARKVFSAYNLVTGDTFKYTWKVKKS